MVDAGVNGAAALAQADLGLPVGTGPDVAIAASNLIHSQSRAAGGTQTPVGSTPC